MKKNYSHLDKVNYKKHDYTNNLFYRCTSRFLWQNKLQVDFMMHLQAIIMSGAKRIKYLVNYQNPINKR